VGEDAAEGCVLAAEGVSSNTIRFCVVTTPTSPAGLDSLELDDAILAQQSAVLIYDAPEPFEKAQMLSAFARPALRYVSPHHRG
jgi:hypothetical protein